MKKYIIIIFFLTINNTFADVKIAYIDVNFVLNNSIVGKLGYWSILFNPIPILPISSILLGVKNPYISGSNKTTLQYRMYVYLDRKVQIMYFLLKRVESF